MKRWTAAALAATLLCTAVPCAQAATNYEDTAADALYEMGLFRGVGQNADGSPRYELDQEMTRQEAITMFVRLLGQEEVAQSGTWETPFTDVDAWAQPYVGYAYENALTKGIDATHFGGEQTVTQAQYATFLLRALGYVEGTDFDWNDAAYFAKDLDIIERLHWSNPVEPFTRGQAALASYQALTVPYKGENTCMLGDLDGRPADARRVPLSTEGYLFYWNTEDTLTVAYYNADGMLKNQYEVPVLESIHEPRWFVLQQYEQTEYFYGIQGLYALENGELVQKTDRPVLDMTLLQYGTESSGPIFLTFGSDYISYDGRKQFAGDTIIEILEDGRQAVRLDAASGQRIASGYFMGIDGFAPSSSNILFTASRAVGMGNYDVYTYCLMGYSYWDETMGSDTSVQVIDYNAGRPETETGWSPENQNGYKPARIEMEQQRLNELGVGMSQNNIATE